MQQTLLSAEDGVGELRNWISTRTIWNEVAAFVFDAYGYTGLNPQDNVDFETLSNTTSEICWQFIINAADCRIQLTSGQLAPAEPELRFCLDPNMPKSRHFDLRIGTVGSGDGENARVLGVDAQTFYGSSYLGAVLFSAKQFKTYWDRYQRDVRKAPVRSRVSEPQEIVDCWLSEPDMTKGRVQAHFGSRFTYRKFEELWREACVIEPKLAGRGRRKARKPLQETPA